MATTPLPKQTVRPPLPPPGPSNIIIITPNPFPPSKEATPWDKATPSDKTGR